jgi:ArsR family transcriptional regulator, arsenate/arsenite/antimonite-responsive transcriptional repressor
MPTAVAELDLQPISRLFRALGDETRLRIVALLAHGELCVCHIQEALGISQPNASQQLAVLRNAGVVSSRRAGGWVYYRLARQDAPVRASQLKALVAAFGRQDALKKDVERLRATRGPNACLT